MLLCFRVASFPPVSGNAGSLQTRSGNDSDSGVRASHLGLHRRCLGKPPGPFPDEGVLASRRSKQAAQTGLLHVSKMMRSVLWRTACLAGRRILFTEHSL